MLLENDLQDLQHMICHQQYCFIRIGLCDAQLMRIAFLCLQMKIDPYGPAIDICLPLEIIIGNVALNNVELTYNEDNEGWVSTNSSGNQSKQRGNQTGN